MSNETPNPYATLPGPGNRAERADVVIVGARIAGATTAMLLARRGLKVIAVDRAAYGSDTLSTHALMRGAVLSLERWGVLDQIREAGTPAVELAAKAGLDELPELIKREVEALEFTLGSNQYVSGAIRAYLEALSGSSYLHTVVLSAKDNTLVGVYDAKDLVGYLRVAGDTGYEQFRALLAAGNKPELAKLPGYVDAEHAVTRSTTTRASSGTRAASSSRMPSERRGCASW